MIEIFKKRTIDNLTKIHKLMILTDIAYFSFVPKETKMLILTGKRVLSEKDYKEILKISTKPPDLLKKITQQLNLKKESASAVANNKIEIKTNLNKNAINKLNAAAGNTAQAIENKILNNVSDLDKINEMKQNLQNLNGSVDAHINNPNFEKLLIGLENNVPATGAFNPLNSLGAGLNENSNLMNLLANKPVPPELKDLNLLSGPGNNEFLRNLHPGLNSLNMNSQLNSHLKDQIDLAMNNNFNNKLGSTNLTNTNAVIGLNKNFTAAIEIPKAKADDVASLKEDFDDFDDEEDNKSSYDLSKNVTVKVNSNSTVSSNSLSNKTQLLQSVVSPSSVNNCKQKLNFKMNDN